MTPEEKATQDHIKSKVDSIELYLVGDEDHGVKGIIPRVVDIERKQSNMDKKLWVFSGIASTVLVTFKFFGDKLFPHT